MRRYHETIYLAYNLVLDSLELAKQNHEFTTHAKSHFNDKDKSHKVNERLVRKALIALEINPPNPFEVYTRSNKVTKAVFKTSYDVFCVSFYFLFHTLRFRLSILQSC